MSVHRSISLWKFDIYKKSRPLKMNIFDWRFWYFWRLSWRLWNWRNWLNCMRFRMASLEEIGRCRILSWASHGNFSLVFPRPPLTVRCFLWLKKEKMKLWKQKSSRFMFLKWILFLHFQSLQKVFRNTKVFSRRTSFLGVDFRCKYQTPHRLMDLCTLINALVP